MLKLFDSNLKRRNKNYLNTISGHYVYAPLELSRSVTLGLGCFGQCQLLKQLSPILALFFRKPIGKLRDGLTMKNNK